MSKTLKEVVELTICNVSSGNISDYIGILSWLYDMPEIEVVDVILQNI